MSDRDTFTEQLMNAELESSFVGDYELKVITILLERMGEPELMDLIKEHAPEHSAFNDE